MGNQFENIFGLDNKAKQIQKRTERRLRLENAKERTRRHENYGDLKVSRRIPRQIVEQVQARDAGRFFGRPDHICERPGPPHHIVHFEEFLNGRVSGDPHTMDNLESPCQECHSLAHDMHIPSGISIAEFFKEKFVK